MQRHIGSLIDFGFAIQAVIAKIDAFITSTLHLLEMSILRHLTKVLEEMELWH